MKIKDNTFNWTFLIAPLLLLLCLCSQAQQKKQDGVVIKANFKGLPAGKKLYYAPELTFNQKRDSVLTTADGFALKIPIKQSEGDFYNFELEGDLLRIYLEPGILNLKGTAIKPYILNNALFSGSQFAIDQEDYKRYVNEKAEIFYAKLRNEKSGVLTRIDSAAVVRPLQIASREWISKHPRSNYGAATLFDYYDAMLIKIPKDSVVAIFNRLSPQAKNNKPSRR